MMRMFGGGGGLPGVTVDSQGEIVFAPDVVLKGTLFVRDGNDDTAVEMDYQGFVGVTQLAAGEGAAFNARRYYVPGAAWNFPLYRSADASESGQPLLYLSAWDRDFNAPLGEFTVGSTGMAGEGGKAPPSAPASITGNVTTGTLANLQSVIGQLLTALDAKGTITKSTT